MKMKKITWVVLFVLLAGFATAQELKLPYYNAYPPANSDFSYFCSHSFPNGQPAKVTAPGELDVRSCDISAWDLTQYTAQELADVISFDSKTKFPPKAKLPKGFSPKKILQNGKNPGLGVRALHKHGITGEGVSIAVIDQSLLLSHQEYASNVIFYEEEPFWKGDSSSMHAPAVVSIAVGKKVGIAPKARVFALAPRFGEKLPNDRYDARPMTDMLRRVAQINAQLAPDEKIRVVSITRGFNETNLGATEWSEAKNALEKDGVAVFTTNDVSTLSRNHSLDNPEDVSKYCRSAYWFDKESIPHLSPDMTDVVVPTDFRVVASQSGPADYVHFANGGLSWAVPYVAGLYALGVQVYPQLTKKIFMKTALETSDVRSCEYQGESFSMKLINPQRLINKLKELNNK